MRPALRLAAFFLAGLLCVPLNPLGAEPQRMDLGGQWQLTQEGKTEATPATVPGNVHTDLLAAGKIPDPFFRDNERALAWIYQAGWTYRRTFDPPADLRRQDQVLLRCAGLDTVAEVRLNGRPLGQADNMFRTWEFDAKPLLRDGPNTLEVTFSPVAPYIKAFRDRAPKGPNMAVLNDLAHVRKPPYSNGWDFGPRFLTSGIYKPIELVAWSRARLKSVAVTQNLSDPRRARLEVAADAEMAGGNPQGLRVRATVSLAGRPVATAEAPYVPGGRVPVFVDDPQLWWPVGLGSQPLYDVAVELRGADGPLLDRMVRRVGLRTVELPRPQGGTPLRLVVNGQPVFSRGADWIPGDVFPARVSPAKLRRYVQDAAAVHMNTLRVWGGGLYEDDAFYDACDEQGILVWNDFIFACSPYPGNNPEFRQNVAAELADQVNRLRHHPCIAVWCGNNEVHGLITGYKLLNQKEYDTLFHDLIGGFMQARFPEAAYVGGSPEEGDEHNWLVWHVGADFEKYRDSHGWMTEFGFQSFPEPATVAAYTEPADRDSVLSPVNVFHQRNGNHRGNPMILDKMKHYFREGKDFDSTLWLSQINQAYGMEIGIEHWRADWPRSSGCLCWQYNDCWPGPSWSSVDYFGRWKALQYRFRTLYAPVLVTGDVDAGKREVQVRVASELPRAADASLDWTLTDAEGRPLQRGEATIPLPAGTAAVAGPRLALDEAVRQAGAENALLWLTVRAAGETSTKLLTFGLPRDLRLADPGLRTSIVPAGNGFDVTVTAVRPALWTWLSCADADARYSDNFVHLTAGQAVTIRVTPSRPTTAADLGRTLRVQSLYETYHAANPVAAR